MNFHTLWPKKESCEIDSTPFLAVRSLPSLPPLSKERFLFLILKEERMTNSERKEVNKKRGLGNCKGFLFNLLGGKKSGREDQTKHKIETPFLFHYLLQGKVKG